MAREMGPPRQVWNRRRRTREGPELACVQAPLLGVAHAGVEGWINILPWYSLVGVAKTSSETQRSKSRAAPKRVSGRHVVRGRQSSPILKVRPGNRQGLWKRAKFRWNGRQLTLDKTVDSRDTLKALAGDRRPIQGGDRPRRRLQGRYRLGHRPVVLLRTETAQCTVRPT